MKQSFFWSRDSLREEEGVGGDTQRGVVVKAAPTAALEMAEAKLLFELLVVALDTPAQLGDAHQFLERSGGGQGAQEVFGRRGLAAGPFDEQPLLGVGLDTQVVAVRAAHPQRGKARGQGFIGAFTPSDGVETPAWPLHRQRLGAQRLVLGIAAQPLRLEAAARPRLRRERGLPLRAPTDPPS